MAHDSFIEEGSRPIAEPDLIPEHPFVIDRHLRSSRAVAPCPRLRTACD
jgi:hypothetical protein